jgi:hypothetical protein
VAIATLCAGKVVAVVSTTTLTSFTVTRIKKGRLSEVLVSNYYSV